MASEEPALKLGTFLGVFTPTVLTILGVILYLRLGWVVGNAGTLGTLAIVILASAITFITAMSLSALATNMRVGVGGAYWLISRSLGLEIGGALGFPLYLSQALSVTLYAFGLAESVRLFWPGAPVQPVAAVVVMLVAALAARSTVLALKAQLPIMALIALSLLSLLAGTGVKVPRVESWGPWLDGDFWSVFAVFFPAVTGILAGLGLSGDLADPVRSIPRGVLAAWAVGVLVYLFVPVALAGVADAETLRGDPLLWTRISLFSPAVMLGLWGAILSSAIGSILGAPRTLQALAADGLVPGVLGRTDPRTGEPTVALYLSTTVALGAVLIGDLNHVAEVVSMFFLTTYGLLNLAAGLEKVVRDPSFRPRVRVPAWGSFLGAIGCFVAMLAIAPDSGLIAIAIELGIWWWLSRRAIEAAWGDLRTGLWFALARMAMFRLREARMEPRNWRPHILVFTRDLTRSLDVVRLASRFSQDHGIVTVCTLLTGGVEDHAAAEERRQRDQELLDRRGIPAFAITATVPDVEAGLLTVVQASSFGGIGSNMVALGWPGEDIDGLARLLRVVRRMAARGLSSMIVRPGRPPRREGAMSWSGAASTRSRGDGRPQPSPSPGSSDIVVWWKGREHNGDLMLLLAHLLRLSDRMDGDWERPVKPRRIVLATMVEDEEQAEARRRECAAMLPAIRIDAHVKVIVQSADRTTAELIRDHSREAGRVFLGMAVAEPGREEVYARRLIDLLDGMPTTILVRNAGPFRGRLV